MKKITLLLIFAFCLTFIGCGRIYGPVEEAKAFAEQKEEVLSQMKKKLEANPTEAAVDEARKIFEAQKDSLIAKRNSIKAAPQGLNNDWRINLNAIDARHDKMLNEMGIIFITACEFQGQQQCRDKWTALAKDFEEAVDKY